MNDAKDRVPHAYGESHYLTAPDGRKLHYMTNGAGRPTVVFESGMGFSRSTWGLVQPAVAKHTRAVVYDRAGTGRSGEAPGPRTLRRIVDDLLLLLDELGPGPFVLVGHSWGGPIVRAAAAAVPERIRGIVLVDPSDENADLYFKPGTARWFAFSRILYPVLARLGLYRLLGSKYGSVQPPDIARDHREEDFTPRAARTAGAELKTFLPELAALRERPPALGSLEVSVISGTQVNRQERKIRPALVEAHQKTAASLERARWVEAANSAHLVPFTEPELIVAEIMRLLDQASS
ncbi:alpha/beta fold hydrolase [Cohnella cellulosilytica]|uniref:Alpha/beta fold hydrolase n=1 Tax=Cohnella cellulosilytica TaxID=986710 RepID=A0ABW2F657_9BACL